MSTNFAELVLGANTRDLITAKRDLRGVTDEGAKAERQAKKTGEEIDNMGDEARGAAADMGKLSKASKAGRGALLGVAGAVAAGVAALVSFGAAVRTISEFESSMSRLGAVSRATADELYAMRDVAADLGSSTEFSATQAADGLNFLAMAGFSVSKSIAAIPSVLNLATASGMGLAQSADIASNVMSGFGIEADNAASVADVLAAASTRANTDVAQLGQAMSTVAPIAAALDIGLGDTAAAIGVLSDAGIQGARAGTALRGVLASLAGPTEQAKGVLDSLGLTIEDVNPEASSLSEIMGRLGKASLTTADAMTIFGREAASGALVLVEGSRRLGEFGDELRDVDGAAKDMADTMRDNLGGDIKGLQSAVSGLVLELGDAGLTAVLRGVVQAITGVTRAASSAVGAVSSLFSTINAYLASSADMESADRAREAAIDSVTFATGDYLRASNNLQSALQTGVFLSLEAAEAKLQEAQARRDAIVSLEEELNAQARANAIADEPYQRLGERLQLAQDALRGMGEQTIANSEQFEAMEQTIVNILNQQKAILAAATHETLLTEEQIALKQQVEANIAAIRARMADLNGEISSGISLTERLSTTANYITFDAAISGAQALSQNLGVSLSLAREIIATTQSTKVDDEVFDPRSPRYNPNLQRKANRERKLAEIRKSFEQVNQEVAKLGSISSGGARAASSGFIEMERAAEAWSERVKTSTERYSDDMAEVRELHELGYFSAEEYGRAVDYISEKYGEASVAAENWGNNMSGHFDGLITGGRDFGDVLKGIVRQLESNAWRSLFSGDLFGGGSAGGLFGGAIIPGILHDGGTAGTDGYNHNRAFHPSTWNNAKRYHNGGIAGLRPNEVPAILERGERVIPNGQSGGGQIEMIVQTDPSVIVDIAKNTTALGIKQATPQIERSATARVERRMRQTKSRVMGYA